MTTPFTIEQFFSVFENYNNTVFPAQILILLLGLLALFMLHKTVSKKDRIISWILGLLWIWTGLFYHITFFTDINKAAYGFGVIFIIQGLLLLWEGVFKERIKLQVSGTAWGYTGYFFTIYGLIIYPIVNYFVGHDLHHTISLGLPCPTVIFTFGLFLLSDKKFPMYLLIIPVLWAVVGISAVLNLKVYQDIVMVISASIVTGFLIRRGKVNG
ncbi:MAG: DUF6064 family protein [Bacteroidales bacterium]